MTKKIYISTTLPYANSNPHVGHALEFVQADFLARYYRKDNDVFFNLGLDEHGQKIFDASQILGVDTKEYLDNHYQSWLEFCQKFNIEYDNFYRTSDKEHCDKVQSFWNSCIKRGDIYKKEYTGIYCVGCESFKTDRDLVDGVCPDHPHLDLQEINEENYFFKLSKYKDNLIQWIDENPQFLLPNFKLNELKNIIENVEDISVSRLKDSVSWGIPVPEDADQTIYVWFDALLNYIFAAGEYWDGETIQICGPDNLRFQAVIFQGLLASAGIDKTNKLLVHGTILDSEGKKMAKSVGNVIDPVDQFDKYGIDAVRYYILSLSTFGNSSWSEEDLISLYNTHLANDYGNLIARTLHLIDSKNVEITSPTDEFKELIDNKILEVNIDNFNIYEYCSKLNEIVKYGNHYINEKEPWKSDDFSEALNNLYYLLQVVTEKYSPIIPSKVEQIFNALESKKKEILFTKL